MPRSLARLPEEVAVSRSDPIYNAHSYLTKVPVAAIEPFIEAFTAPGDVVLDVFAGSGMTGVAAAMHGRRSVLRDISELARHIGRNYLNLPDAGACREAAAAAVKEAKEMVGEVYQVACADCQRPAELSRTTWTVIYECPACSAPINFYRALEAAEWSKTKLSCPACNRRFKTRGARRLGEEPVLDTVACPCSKRLRDQPPGEAVTTASLHGLAWPEVPIDADRQMYQASALAKHGYLTTASFFSTRNLAALAALRECIQATSEELEEKLMFAFTAILARASKRYQWSRKRPLNAANQHYYVAPVFYEWNVYDLFLRKVEAVLRSDEFLVARMRALGVEDPPTVDYRIGSADDLDLPDASVDYVFTDPPFGSNIFYSDMNLFQEAWLEKLTEHSKEAVVDRSGNGNGRRTAERYEELITGGLRECHRVLKPDGWLSLVFSNSSGNLWALVQRAVAAAEFVIEPDGIAILDKGQRSVKGLTSGFEHVVTADLILSMRKAKDGERIVPAPAPDRALESCLDRALRDGTAPTPSHVYLTVVRHYLRQHWDVSGLSISAVAKALGNRGYAIVPATGRLRAPATDQPS